MEVKKLTYMNWWQKGADINPPAPEVIPTPEPVQQQSAQPTQGVPYIQPLVVVPYVSNEQPMYYYDASALQKGNEGSEEYYEDMFESEESAAIEAPMGRVKKSAAYYDEEPEAESVSVGKKRRANVFAILSFILCGIYIALLFDLTKLLSTFTYNFLYDNLAAFNIIKAFVESIIAGGFVFDVNTTLVPILVSAGAVFMVITAICSIVTVASRTPIAIKIIAGLAFLLNAGAAIVAKFVVKMDITTYGLYILAGVSLIVFVFTMIARNKKNK